MGEGYEASASFIDVLPTELHENILRFVSSLPNSNKWEIHIDLVDLVELIALPNEFGSYLKSRFTTLIVSRRKNYVQDHGELPWENRHGPYLWTNSIHIAHQYVLAGGGQSLETLVVETLVVDKLTRTFGRESIVDDFLAHCPNVNSLSISECDSTWVHKFRNQIDKLGIREFESLDLPTHIPNLRELNLALSCPASIPEVFWNSVGCSLEKLVMEGLFNAETQANAIKRHCRGLKSILFGSCDGNGIAATATLLKSYGDQLDYAYLRGMNEVQVREVVAACPNARMDFVNLKGRFSSTAVNLIAPKLECMSSIEDLAENGDDAEWRYLWNKCINIRELYIPVVEFTEVKQIFSAPKEHLKVLTLEYFHDPDAEESNKVMKLCADGTLCIEKLIYYGPKFYGDGSKKFLEKNRATLKSIELRRPRYKSSEELGELLDLLLDLPALEELMLDCKMPTGKLKTLEKRGIYWKRDPLHLDIPGALYPAH